MNYLPQAVETPTFGSIDATSLSSGFGHSCATSVAQFAYCWGFNMFGQIGDGSTGNRNSAVLVLSDAVSISAGRVHSCAIKTDHSSWCWGNNLFGEIGQDPASTESRSPLVVSDVSDAVEIVAGGPGYSDADDFTCALRKDGSVQCWGSDLYGQLGNMQMSSNPTFRPVKAAVTCP
jgi:alpha-tubulin suppressor-like RCC1 family protein